ncbi:hypothetical protein DJ468_00860 [Candidatus Liberibacter asiaticus]|nr:hypothetical protein DJ468_00860 [Candidatus Liberibacter asiaticus]
MIIEPYLAKKIDRKSTAPDLKRAPGKKNGKRGIDKNDLNNKINSKDRETKENIQKFNVNHSNKKNKGQ